MEDINLAEALQITINCMLIVFIVLVILMGLVSLFKYLPETKIRTHSHKVKKDKYVSFCEMDEDMKVAALVATIKYKEETKKEVKLKSIRRI